MKEVVSGVIIRKGSVFLTQRKHDQTYPFKFETPGGKVKLMEETPRQALARELFEEIDFGGEPELIIAPEPFFVADFELNEGRPPGPVKISFYLVTIPDDCWPTGAEGQGSLWASIAEMRSLRLAPGNMRAAALIEREMVRLR